MTVDTTVEVAVPRLEVRPIASTGHLVGFLLAMAGTAAFGFWAQYRNAAGPSAGGAGQLAAHPSAVGVYVVALLMDWALFYYCWVGVHWAGGGMPVLLGGRWASGRAAAVDAGLVVPFWLVWTGTALAVRWLVGTGTARAVDGLLPRTGPEVVMWVLLSLTAGFCEEVAFRGYLQRQLRALTGRAAVAVAGQAVVFGVAHAYQGWRSVVVITALGTLYGWMAVWRGNLRVNMVAHAWSDFWEGWLKHVV